MFHVAFSIAWAALCVGIWKYYKDNRYLLFAGLGVLNFMASGAAYYIRHLTEATAWQILISTRALMVWDIISIALIVVIITQTRYR
jgi:hypothetical protein